MCLSKSRDPRCLTEYNTMQYKEIKQNQSFQERINIEFHYVSTIGTFLFSFVFNVHFVREEDDGGSSSSGHNMETVIVMIVVVQPLFVWLPDEVHLFKYDHMVFAARVWHALCLSVAFLLSQRLKRRCGGGFRHLLEAALDETWIILHTSLSHVPQCYCQVGHVWKNVKNKIK